MPMYTYLCTNEDCLEEKDTLQTSYDDNIFKVCPVCGSVSERVIYTSCFKDSVKGWFYHHEDDTPSNVLPSQLVRARKKREERKLKNVRTDI